MRGHHLDEMEFEDELDGTKVNIHSERVPLPGLHIPQAIVQEIHEDPTKIPTIDSRKSVMIKGRCPSELGSARNNQSLIFASNSSYPGPIQNKRQTIYEPLQSRMLEGLDPYVAVNTRNESKAV